MVTGVETIVTQHFEMLFRDMNNQPFYKVKGRNTFRNILIVFMSCVVKGNVIAIIFVNTGSGNNRTTEISADIFNSDIGSTEIWFGSDIKAVGMESVHPVFDFAEGWTEFLCESFEKDFSEGIAQKGIVEMFNRPPWSNITGTALRNKGVYVWIPLEVTTESVKDTDYAGSKVFSFIHFGEHTQNNIADGLEKTVQESAVTEKINAEFFGDGKNTVPMNTGNEFA